MPIIPGSKRRLPELPQTLRAVVDAGLIEWADLIFAMEAIHQRRMREKFPSLLRQRKVIVLGIPDNYEYMDKALVARLKEKVVGHLKT